MAQCPACNAPLNDDFGLVDCSQCGAGLYIEFDGTVKRRDDTQGTIASPGVIDSETPPPIERSSATISRPQAAADFENENLDFAPPPEVLVDEASIPSPSLDDLADFANSEESSARDGAYTYDVSIIGVDTSDLRVAVKDALTDPLFLWDVEAIIKSLNNGELKLIDLTPVKASLVVQRLGSLPLQISWVQHALVEP